jgi:protein phosphatase
LININVPRAFSEVGSRDSNEDNVYPDISTGTIDDSIFLVCDGVGGCDRGEIASKLACERFAEYFFSHPIKQSDARYWENGLKFVEGQFDDYFIAHPASKGMGTTLTLIHLHDVGATVGHIGDSRVYQYRDGEIIFQTKDHSLVNEMVEAGMITAAEARTHAKRNVINRAIQGTSVKPTKIDVAQLRDIQVGDYFFMCTDGVLDAITDFEIGQILKEAVTDQDKMNQIEQRCSENSSDNYSAYLIGVAEVI